MINFFNIKHSIITILLNAAAWVAQYCFWLTVFLVIILITFFGTADMHDFRYVGF